MRLILRETIKYLKEYWPALIFLGLVILNHYIEDSFGLQ